MNDPNNAATRADLAPIIEILGKVEAKLKDGNQTPLIVNNQYCGHGGVPITQGPLPGSESDNTQNQTSEPAQAINGGNLPPVSFHPIPGPSNATASSQPIQPQTGLVVHEGLRPFLRRGPFTDLATGRPMYMYPKPTHPEFRGSFNSGAQEPRQSIRRFHWEYFSDGVLGHASAGTSEEVAHRRLGMKGYFDPDTDQPSAAQVYDLRQNVRSAGQEDITEGIDLAWVPDRNSSKSEREELLRKVQSSGNDGEILRDIQRGAGNHNDQPSRPNSTVGARSQPQNVLTGSLDVEAPSTLNSQHKTGTNSQAADGQDAAGASSQTKTKSLLEPRNSKPPQAAGNIHVTQGPTDVTTDQKISGDAGATPPSARLSMPLDTTGNAVNSLPDKFKVQQTVKDVRQRSRSDNATTLTDESQNGKPKPGYYFVIPDDDNKKEVGVDRDPVGNHAAIIKHRLRQRSHIADQSANPPSRHSRGSIQPTTAPTAQVDLSKKDGQGKGAQNVKTTRNLRETLAADTKEDAYPGSSMKSASKSRSSGATTSGPLAIETDTASDISDINEEILEAGDDKIANSVKPSTNKRRASEDTEDEPRRKARKQSRRPFNDNIEIDNDEEELQVGPENDEDIIRLGSSSRRSTWAGSAVDDLLSRVLDRVERRTGALGTGLPSETRSQMKRLGDGELEPPPEAAGASLLPSDTSSVPEQNQKTLPKKGPGRKGSVTPAFYKHLRDRNEQADADLLDDNGDSSLSSPSQRLNDRDPRANEGTDGMAEDQERARRTSAGRKRPTAESEIDDTLERKKPKKSTDQARLDMARALGALNERKRHGFDEEDEEGVSDDQDPEGDSNTTKTVEKKPPGRKGGKSSAPGGLLGFGFPRSAFPKSRR